MFPLSPYGPMLLFEINMQTTFRVNIYVSVGRRASSRSHRQVVRALLLTSPCSVPQTRLPRKIISSQEHNFVAEVSQLQAVRRCLRLHQPRTTCHTFCICLPSSLADSRVIQRRHRPGAVGCRRLRRPARSRLKARHVLPHRSQRSAGQAAGAPPSCRLKPLPAPLSRLVLLTVAGTEVRSLAAGAGVAHAREVRHVDSGEPGCCCCCCWFCSCHCSLRSDARCPGRRLAGSTLLTISPRARRSWCARRSASAKLRHLTRATAGFGRAAADPARCAAGEREACADTERYCNSATA